MSFTRSIAAAAAAAATCVAAGVLAAADDPERQYCERQKGAVRAVCLRELERSRKDESPASAASDRTPAAKAPATAPTRVDAANPDDRAKPYKTADGKRVDAQTYKGWQTWRAAACDRCHGANQEGLVGPSLIASLKTLSKAEFEAAVKRGRLQKGMPSFGENPTVVSNLDGLYAYLKGRSDGAITQSRVEPM